MKKIKVIFTGGTIGSLANGNDISPNASTRYMLLEEYSKKYGKTVDRFEAEAPLSILSENAIIDDVIKIAKEVKKAEKENYGGIIVTHGSDTLAYSSAYLSMLLQNLKIPVVLVASNFTITSKNANGVVNFATAVDVIDNERVKPGVYVTYKNPQDDFTSVHLGCRMCEPAPYSDSFHSPENQRYAKWKNGNIKFENTKVEKTNKTFEYRGLFDKKILVINPYTGLDYNVYKNGNYDLVLHNMYHSGTANTQNYLNKTFDTNLLNFVDYCESHDIPVYLCNIKKRDVNYNSTNQILKRDVKFLYDILPNVALAKLNIAYNLVREDEREDFLNSSVAGEILEDRQYIQQNGQQQD